MSWPNHLTKLSNESYKHFVAKAILFWILRDMKHDVSSEWKVPNGYADLCDKTTRTLYEIEFHVSKEYQNRKIEQYRMPGYEIIIVDCSRIHADIDEIRKYLGHYILPNLSPPTFIFSHISSYASFSATGYVKNRDELNDLFSQPFKQFSSSSFVPNLCRFIFFQIQ